MFLDFSVAFVYQCMGCPVCKYNYIVFTNVKIKGHKQRLQKILERLKFVKKTRSIVYGMYVLGCQVDFVDPDRIDGFLFFNT